MNTIFKYKLEVGAEQLIDIPEGATILCVQVQHGKPCLWAMCNPNNLLSKRKILTYGTGHNVPDSTGPYIGSYQLEEGLLVCHVFDS